MHKFANELIAGDKILIGGLVCTVKKVEDVFHYVPTSRVRISITINHASSKWAEGILFLSAQVPIEII